MVGRTTFDRKTYMNLLNFPSKTHLIIQGCQACLWEASWSLLDRYSDQIWTKVLFLANGHVSKFQKCLFFRNKSPCGSILTKGTFWKLTSNELIHVHDNLKKWLFTNFVLLVTLFHIRTIFCWKPKWSVWSIWTYSTGWIFKFAVQKINLMGKLKT